MDFDAYCISKKIDPQLFKQNEPEKYQHWILDFENTSVASFTSQKLYLINNLRRKYHYQAPIINLDNTALAENKIEQNNQIDNIEKQNDQKVEPVISQPSAKPVMKKPMMKPIIPKSDSKLDEQ